MPWLSGYYGTRFQPKMSKKAKGRMQQSAKQRKRKNRR